MSCIGVLTLFSVVVCSQCYFSVFSFSKTLYIPGQYYSLINFTQSIEPLSNYFNISVDFSLTQVDLCQFRACSQIKRTPFTTHFCSIVVSILPWSPAINRQSTISVSFTTNLNLAKGNT